MMTVVDGYVSAWLKGISRSYVFSDDSAMESGSLGGSA